MSNKNMNADGQQGSSKYSGETSSGNDKLGLGDYARGTSASRQGALYGGDSNQPIDYPRAGSSSHGHDMNAGNPSNKPSSEDALGITDKLGAKGTVSSRENMTAGGDENTKGHIYGKGAGSNKPVSVNDVLLSGIKTQYGTEKTVQGSGDQNAVYAKSMKGYRKKLSE